MKKVVLLVLFALAGIAAAQQEGFAGFMDHANKVGMAQACSEEGHLKFWHPNAVFRFEHTPNPQRTGSVMDQLPVCHEWENLFPDLKFLPGRQFRSGDAIINNFHLSGTCSTNQKPFKMYMSNTDTIANGKASHSVWVGDYGHMFATCGVPSPQTEAIDAIKPGAERKKDL